MKVNIEKIEETLQKKRIKKKKRKQDLFGCVK